MAYLTIAGTAYRVRADGSSGRRIQIEQRTRAWDGSLIRSVRTVKKEATVEIIGPAAGGLFTIAQADTLMGILTAGNVAIAGDIGTFTAAARDIGYRDLVAVGLKARLVTATFEQV